MTTETTPTLDDSGLGSLRSLANALAALHDAYELASTPAPASHARILAFIREHNTLISVTRSQIATIRPDEQTVEIAYYRAFVTRIARLYGRLPAEFEVQVESLG